MYDIQKFIINVKYFLHIYLQKVNQEMKEIVHLHVIHITN